jgi:hypothetical protein
VTDQQLLEARVRTALDERARTQFPDQQPPQLALAGMDKARSPWLVPILAAAAVAAILVGTVTAIRAPDNSHSVAPAAPNYPEASQVSGVKIVPPNKQELGIGSAVGFMTGPPKGLVAGRVYHLSERVAYKIADRKGTEPLLLTLSSQGDVLQGPPPFIVRAGYVYEISYTLIPIPGTGSLTTAITGLYGSPPLNSGTVQITAIRSPSVTPPAAPKYPEATQVAGVKIVPANKDELTHADGIDFETASQDTIVAGKPYRLTERVGYLVDNPKGTEPSVLELSGEGISVQGPPAFIIRAGYAYEISFTVLAPRGTATLTTSVTSLDGPSQISKAAQQITAK